MIVVSSSQGFGGDPGTVWPGGNILNIAEAELGPGAPYISSVLLCLSVMSLI